MKNKNESLKIKYKLNKEILKMAFLIIFETYEFLLLVFETEVFFTSFFILMNLYLFNKVKTIYIYKQFNNVYAGVNAHACWQIHFLAEDVEEINSHYLNFIQCHRQRVSRIRISNQVL